MKEIHSLRNELTRRFERAGIEFSFFLSPSETPKRKKTQCEIHRAEKGQQNWKDAIGDAVTLSLADARDFDSFVKALAEKGITITRETKNSMTLRDSQGRPCRLGKLFSNMKSRADIINHINQNKTKEEKKMEKVATEKEKLKTWEAEGESYLRKKGTELWKAEMRNAIRASTAEATNWNDFKNSMQAKGFDVFTKADKSVIIQNSDKKMCSVGRLFEGIETKQDIIECITGERRLEGEDESKDNNSRKMEQLLRAERSFTNRLYSHAEDMLKHGKTEFEVNARLEKILAHRSESEDVQERWAALKTMQAELKDEHQIWYEEKRTIRQQQYEQQRQQREQEYQARQRMQTLQRVLSSNNPITAFAASLAMIITTIAQQQKQQQRQQNQYQHGDLNKDGVTETLEQELLKKTINPKQTLKPEPEPIRKGFTMER
jgi:hypothetical protein